MLTELKAKDIVIGLTVLYSTNTGVLHFVIKDGFCLLVKI